jgi:hypothetical protein
MCVCWIVLPVWCVSNVHFLFLVLCGYCVLHSSSSASSDILQEEEQLSPSSKFDARAGLLKYEVVSKIFRTGATNHIAVVAQRICPNRPNCEFRVLLRLLRRLRENVRRRRPELWQEQTWLLHHDNAPFHIFVLTQQFLAKN